jgi:hypothetical protein
MAPAERTDRRAASARNGLSAVVLAGLLAVLGGCTSSAEDMCDYKCECEGCSAHDYDVCVGAYDNDYYDADRRDCADYYDDLLACQEDTWFCNGSKWETHCGPEKDRLNHCID